MRPKSPLLETRSGSAGQVIDEKQIALMPLSDGNPFVLARLAPGVAYHGDLKFSRPFDNGGTSDFTADGGPGRNEFTLDGSPNMANGRRVAFVPPAGAVQEFKVETATFDAQQGHTAGATVNVTLKSGTNRVRGDAYYHYRDEVLSANDFFLERAGRPKDDTGYKRYGFTAGGPVALGKLYDGRNKTFFFTAFEWLYDTFPEPGQFTVPTEAQRNGDFSALLSQGIVIYDPLTAVRRADGRIERQPFPGNIIQARPLQRDRPELHELLSATQPGGGCAGSQQLHHRQSARRRFLLDELPGRPQPDGQAALFRALLAQQPRGAPRQLDRGRQRHQAHRQFPVPHQRCTQPRSRLDDVEFVAAERAGELVAVPGAEHPSEPGDLRSGQPRISDGRHAVLREQPLLPALRDGRRGVVQRPRRFLLRRHQREYLLGSADLDLVSWQAQFSLGRRFSRLPGGELPERALRGALRLRARERVDAAARQLTGRGDWPGHGGHAARLPERRHDRPQRRSIQSGDVRRRLLPGRLEGQLGADGESGPALGIRGRADRAIQPQRAWLRSGRRVDDHERGASRLRGQPDSRDRTVGLPRARWPAVL